jgi:hypothetical protein
VTIDEFKTVKIGDYVLCGEVFDLYTYGDYMTKDKRYKVKDFDSYWITIDDDDGYKMSWSYEVFDLHKTDYNKLNNTLLELETLF